MNTPLLDIQPVARPCMVPASSPMPVVGADVLASYVGTLPKGTSLSCARMGLYVLGCNAAQIRSAIEALLRAGKVCPDSHNALRGPTCEGLPT